MKQILPTNEREQMLCDYWKEQGAKHTEPSKETLKILNSFDIVLTKMDGRIETVQKTIEDMKENDDKIVDLEKEDIRLKAEMNTKNAEYLEWKKGFIKNLVIIYTICAGIIGFFATDYFTSRDSNIVQGEKIINLEKDVSTIKEELKVK